jgi:hypothetical protein
MLRMLLPSYVVMRSQSGHNDPKLNIYRKGDNTRYFHLIANGKHRRKKIFQLEQDEGTIIGQENIKNYISEYYKMLFGPPMVNTCSMEETRNQEYRKFR